jgi:SAM-dependent methyltransferase
MDLAPDGSPVAFYRRLPAGGEPELIHAVLRSGSTILDLGCGPGRIAGPLTELGHRVTGIDDGPGMVAALPSSVEGVVADATTIRLARRFDAVLLVSHLVNDPARGTAFARTAAAHVAPDGVVVGQTYPPGWDPSTAVGTTTQLGDATVTMVSARMDGDLLAAEVRYGVDGRLWSQRFTARVLDESALRRLLAEAGMIFDQWLERPGWFLALPAEHTPTPLPSDPGGDPRGRPAPG